MSLSVPEPLGTQHRLEGFDCGKPSPDDWLLRHALLQDAIRRTLLVAEQAGIRALLTHPVDEDAAHFYARFGFIASPLREQQLLLLLKDARRWVK